jgi:hypothetical protein
LGGTEVAPTNWEPKWGCALDISSQNAIVPLSFWQQIVEYLIKFEILTLALGFLILKFLTSNGYSK